MPSSPPAKNVQILPVVPAPVTFRQRQFLIAIQAITILLIFAFIVEGDYFREKGKEKEFQPQDLSSSNNKNCAGSMGASLQFSTASLAEIELSYNKILSTVEPQHENLAVAFTRALNVLHHRSYVCKNQLSVGGKSADHPEGAWTVCADFWKLDTPNIEDATRRSNITDCVVYSFGIANDFSFDDGMAKRNCLVFSFDPSMTDYAEKVVRSENSIFYREGLGASNQNGFEGKSMLTGEQQKWKMDSVMGFMTRLNHKHLTVLKIDIEYGEWDALEVMLKHPTAMDNIDQMIFEVHFWSDRRRTELNEVEEVQRWGKILMGMELKGFRQYYVHTNPISSYVMAGFSYKPVPCCYEVSFVKVK